jgi:hypothetical protein
MLWLIQNILFSISLIVVIHYLYVYFETTLTAPKVKDLIHCPKQKYKSLFDTINKNLDNNVSQSAKLGGRDEKQNGSSISDTSDLGTGSKTKMYNDDSSHIASKENNDMKTDLKEFLRGIGLKSQARTDMTFKPSYETS